MNLKTKKRNMEHLRGVVTVCGDGGSQCVAARGRGRALRHGTRECDGLRRARADGLRPTAGEHARRRWFVMGAGRRVHARRIFSFTYNQSDKNIKQLLLLKWESKPRTMTTVLTDVFLNSLIIMIIGKKSNLNRLLVIWT